ncbi:NucA/NucB deoxyribonuclease domain-containing protein [Streptomyces sp. NBC_01707]|uniref:NucA/NucB deoxyribonuclease domain-containing protein n=1 Tax=Streptomyces sp. NBC_01707 TaxID=2975914 RepID=UPI00352EB88B
MGHGGDVTEELTADHREVNGLFDRIEAVPARGRAISSRKPLHPAVDVVWDLESSQRVPDNRTNRTAACAALSPSGTPAGKQCDEYPFASVWEGAGVGDNNFSVRYVDSAQNNNAGNELGAWYQNQRILGREAFFVQIYS